MKFIGITGYPLENFRSVELFASLFYWVFLFWMIVLNYVTSGKGIICFWVIMPWKLPVLQHTLKLTFPGGHFLKALETFRVCKAIFRWSVSKNRELYMPEMHCTKRTSPRISNFISNTFSARRSWETIGNGKFLWQKFMFDLNTDKRKQKYKTPLSQLFFN